MIGMLKREVDMLKSQLEHTNHTAHTKVEDEIVEWEPEKVISTKPLAVVPEIIPEESIEEVKMTDVQKETIRKSLIRNQGNRKATAAELGLSERTLYRKIKEYNL